MHYENFYENLEEASFRLNQSIVMYDGQPVYIHSLENNTDGIVRVRIQELPLDEAKINNTTRKMINSPKFNRFRPFELGNMNLLASGVIYPYRLERVPVRTRTQGTTQTNTRLNPLFPELRNPNFGFNSLLYNEGFVEMCRGVYPTWDEYIETGIPSCALSRDIAIRLSEDTGLRFLKYKELYAGIVTEKGVVALYPKYNYLREAIEELKVFSGVKTNLFD